MRQKTQPLFIAGLVLLALAPQAALADAEALRQCRALGDAAARLACYDAIALPAPQPAAGVAPATPAAVASAAVPAVATRQARFGLPEERRPAGEAERMDSRIDGRFEGWGPRGRIRLANGQVWQVTDDSRGAYWLDSPKVTVRRGALGSYLMEIEGVRTLVRVVRLE